MAEIIGSQYNDNITTSGKSGYVKNATADDDTITTLNGNDLVHAGAGNDTIDGGDGNDEIHGEAGNDVIWGDIGPISLLLLS
jgi:Ca2+-binding RTX toxin-like protein